MEMSAAGLELLKKSEGFRERVYRDVAGIPTIGYGHRLHPGESFECGITEAEATAILERDLSEAEKNVSHCVHVPLTQGQFDALVDFVFNLGIGRLTTSTLLKLLNAGNYEAACEHLLLWDYAAGRELPALKARRQAEAALWHGQAEVAA